MLVLEEEQGSPAPGAIERRLLLDHAWSGGAVALALLSGCGAVVVSGEIGLVARARVSFISAVVMVGERGLSFQVTPKGAAPFTALIVDQANG